MNLHKIRWSYSSIGDGVKNPVIRFHSGSKNTLIYKIILRLRHFGCFASNPRLTLWSDRFRPFRPFAVVIPEGWHYYRNVSPH